MRMNVGPEFHLQRKAICWLLIAAVFALTVQPMHIHLQHIDDTASLTHRHVIDLHFTVDNLDPANHKDAAVFAVAPDVMLKKLGDNSMPAAIFVCLSILLLSIAYTIKQRSTISFKRPKPGWYFLAPPLRAPPRL